MRAVDARLTVECVLTCVDLVPRGRVVSYGDIAAIVETSARRVGSVLSTHGSAVAWWRVVYANGSLPLGLLPDARRHWRAEGISETATGCAIERHRADLDALAASYARAMGPTA